jgi:Mn-dependent DtxR family transcriptional regulator
MPKQENWEIFRIPKEKSPRGTEKEQVERLLKKNTDGLTVIEIARLLKISRNTVAVALAELKGANLIRVRPIGKAKLNYWGKSR